MWAARQECRTDAEILEQLIFAAKPSRQVGEEGKERHTNQGTNKGNDNGKRKGEAVRILMRLAAQAVGDSNDIAVVWKRIQSRGGEGHDAVDNAGSNAKLGIDWAEDGYCDAQTAGGGTADTSNHSGADHQSQQFGTGEVDHGAYDVAKNGAGVRRSR